MPVIDGTKLVNENLVNAAAFVAMAALKAPKMAQTEIKIEILSGDEVLPLAELLGILGEASAFVAGDATVGKRLMKRAFSSRKDQAGQHIGIRRMRM